MSFPITCTACNKTFTISDEIYEKKVAGRVVTIKCKSCSHGIRVDGTKKESGAAPAPAPTPAAEPAPAAPTEPLWAVEHPDGQDREFTLAEVVTELERGVIGGATLVWRDGMAEWLEVAQVPELSGELARIEAKKKALATLSAAKSATATPIHTPRPPMPTETGLGGLPGAETSSPLAAPKPLVEPKPAVEAPKAVATPKAVEPAKAALPKAVQAPKVGSPTATLPSTPRAKLPSASSLSKPRAEQASGPDLLKPRAEQPSGPDLTKPRAKLPSAPEPIKPREMAADDDVSDTDVTRAMKLPPEFVKARRAQQASSPELPKPRAAQPSSPLLAKPAAPVAPAAATPLPVVAPPPLLTAAETPLPSPPAFVPAAPVVSPAPPVVSAPPPVAPSPPIVSAPPFLSATATPPLPASVAKVVSRPPETVPAFPAAPSVAPAAAFGTVPAIVSDHATVEWPEANKKKPMIIGGLIVAAVLIGGALFFLGGKEQLPPPTPIAPAPANVAAPAKAPTSTPTMAPVSTQSQPGSETASGSDPIMAPRDPGATPGAGFAELFAAGARKAESKGATVAPTARFDAATTKVPLAQAANDAQACKQSGGPTGKVTVVVTFDPSGKVSSATITDAPFAGTATAVCISSALKRASIAPFSGLPGTVSKTFSIL